MRSLMHMPIPQLSQRIGAALNAFQFSTAGPLIVPGFRGNDQAVKVVSGTLPHMAEDFSRFLQACAALQSDEAIATQWGEAHVGYDGDEINAFIPEIKSIGSNKLTFQLGQYSEAPSGLLNLLNAEMRYESERIPFIISQYAQTEWPHAEGVSDALHHPSVNALALGTDITLISAAATIWTLSERPHLWREALRSIQGEKLTPLTALTIACLFAEEHFSSEHRGVPGQMNLTIEEYAEKENQTTFPLKVSEEGKLVLPSHLSLEAFEQSTISFTTGQKEPGYDGLSPVVPHAPVFSVEYVPAGEHSSLFDRVIDRPVLDIIHNIPQGESAARVLTDLLRGAQLLRPFSFPYAS